METEDPRRLSLTDRMEVMGANLGEPHTKAFGDGLLELRLKGPRDLRACFYCTLVGQRIVMLHSFVKKSAKTPPRQRQIAEVRMREVKNADA
ncbi:type II toxin-antitoxin system RelE/ParE family toxin [Bordetella sp. FB-8]|uniref:type II toxin-antitoxin system RelE/ParE family toxin n=1 Tax=Bordetella sp. FB-8 TaxID=1159870 RepID=UPI00037BA416|nr:type II toxin-antitoxin system RelE/ParE family toxin [Bordetella sp. FB-8]